MNTFSTRTRRGAAILFSGVLVLGGLTLTGEATAGQEVEGNPTCEDLGYTYTYKVENPSAGYYTVDRDGMDANLTVGTYTGPDQPDPNENNAILGYSISTTADGHAIVVKGGDGATVYRSGPDGLESPPLHAPAVSSDKWPTISHFQLCWNGPAPQPEPGQLQVTKDVVGADTPDEYTFEICVTPVAGGDRLCKDVVGNGTVTFENLPPGEYVVTETDPGPRFSITGSGVTVTVESEDTATATVTNTWIPPGEESGSVEVTKEVTGEGAPDDDEYTICLEGPGSMDAKVCKTVVGAGTVLFDGLVPGIYQVTEPDPAMEYEVTIDEATVEVTIGEVATSTVTNEYTQQEVVPPTPEVVPPTPEVVPPTPEVVPPTPEVVPPTPEVESLPPTTPTVPVTPATPADSTNVATPTSLPATGSEGGIAAIAAILVATGVGLTLLGHRREPQEA